MNVTQTHRNTLFSFNGFSINRSLMQTVCAATWHMPHEFSLSFLLLLQSTPLHKILKICFSFCLAKLVTIFSTSTPPGAISVQFWKVFLCGFEKRCFLSFQRQNFPDQVVGFFLSSFSCLLLTSGFSPRFAVVRICKCTVAWCLIPLQDC